MGRDGNVVFFSKSPPLGTHNNMTASSDKPRGSGPAAAQAQQLVRVAARKSGLSAALVSEAFEALGAAVCDALLRGQPVKLGPVGTLRPVLTRAGQPKLAISPGSKLLQETATNSDAAPDPKVRGPPAATAAPSRPRSGLRLTLLTVAQARRLLQRVQLKYWNTCPHLAVDVVAHDLMYERFPHLVSPPKAALLRMEDVRGVQAGSFTVVVVQPQSYTKAITLRRTSEVLDKFYALTRQPELAVTGGGGDGWWVLNDPLVRYLRKLDKALDWARTQCPDGPLRTGRQ